MEKTKKTLKTLLFILLNILLFIILLILILSKFLSSSEPIIADNHNSIFLPQDFRDVKEIFNLPYEEVTSVSTKYSILYKDGNNRKMFVFAVLVREMENDKHILFDNKIYENDDGTFKTQNKEFNLNFNSNAINLSYKNLNFSVLLNNTKMNKDENYFNTYGETKEAVKYTNVVDNIDLRCIPTYNGLLMEFDLLNKTEKSEITFEIDINKLKYENDPAGYVKILKDDNNAGVIYQGIVLDNDNRIYTNNRVKISIKDKKYYLTIDLSKLPSDVIYPAKLAFNFDFYCEKMFYDTSVYEATPSTNTILNNVSIFDSINEKHAGYTYMKYNVKSFTPKDSSLIESFTFNFYVISVSDSIEIEVYRAAKDWCSTQINWRDKPLYKEKIGEFTLSEIGWHKIDLTDYVKLLIDRDYDNLNDNGIVFKVKEGSKGYAIWTSADNTYAPPYFEVNYRVS